MRTKQIPTNEWSAFLNSFSSQHEGWLVTLEIFGPEIGAQVEETGLVLQGLTDEWDEVNGTTIMIMAGNKSDDHITHSISHPTEVSLEQTEEGDDNVLSIKSADGATALLSFHAAALPETVDAVVL